MSRKDFELIARTIRHLAQVPDSVLTPEYIAVEFANRLAETNPRFDRARFLRAAITQPALADVLAKGGR